MNASVQISCADDVSPVLRQLVDDLDHYLDDLYGAEPEAYVSIDELTQSGVTFWIATKDDAPVGCVALGVLNENDVELKRLFVLPAARGTGAGRKLLEALEQSAIERGAKRILLETGPRQTDAIALFERFGFKQREIYPGTVWGKGLFFEKYLTPENRKKH